MDGAASSTTPPGVIMEGAAPSTTTAPAGHIAPVPAVLRQKGPTDASAAVELPSGPPPADPQGGESLVREEKDVVQEAQLERRDTAVSCVSEFPPPERIDSGFSVATSTGTENNFEPPGRINSGWSVATSAATDMTELDPASPDVPFGDEAAEFEADIYASSPRRSGLFPFAKVPLQKRPFRAAPACVEPEKPLATIRHRRLGETIQRKSSLNISSGPTAPDAHSEPAPPSALVEPSPLSAREPLIPRLDPKLENDDDGGSIGHGSQDRDLPGCSAPVTSRVTSLPALEDVAEGWQAPKTEDGGAGEAETPADTDTDDGAPTPGKTSMTTAGSPRVGEAVASARGPTTPEERPTSWCSESSDSRDEDDSRRTPDLDDEMLQDVCEQVLLRAFGIQLDDVALAGVAPAVYESLSHCLDELAHILLNTGLSRSSIQINEATQGTTAHSAAPIWHTGASAGRTGGEDEGNADGNRKRANDRNGDRADPGDEDDSPGGRKRKRVSAGPRAPDMSFSCPFRKRNPVRFNVRDFESCALQPHSGFALVKRHIKEFHEQPPLCPRCKRNMETQEAVDGHLTAGNDWICDLRRVDPEDGITKMTEARLNERKSDGKVDSWDGLWHVLFPDDTNIPTPDFIPPTDLEEVHAKFNADPCRDQLRQLLHKELETTKDVEGIAAAVKSYIDSVFDECRATTSSVPGGQRQTRAQGSRQAASRQGSVRHRPQTQSLAYQGSGVSDSSNSSPIATPGSNSSIAMGTVVLPFRLEPRAPRLHSKTGGGYPEPGSNGAGGGGPMMPPLPGLSPGILEGTQPRPLSRAALLAQNSMGFVYGPQSLAADAPVRPRGQGHTPNDSGVGFGADFPGPGVALDLDGMNHRAINCPAFPPTGFNPNTGYPSMGFAQQTMLRSLAQRPLPDEMHRAAEASLGPDEFGYLATSGAFFQGGPPGQ